MAGDAISLDVSLGQVKDPAAALQMRRLIQYMPPYLGRLDADPDTTGWGAEMEGTFWWNLASHGYKSWNGSSIVSGL